MINAVGLNSSSVTVEGQMLVDLDIPGSVGYSRCAVEVRISCSTSKFVLL